MDSSALSDDVVKTKKVRSFRQRKRGVVKKISDSFTITVCVFSREKDTVCKKIFTKTRSYCVHVPSGLKVSVGDKVEIMSCRRISKRKSWRLTKVIPLILGVSNDTN